MPVVYISGDSAPDWASKGVSNSGDRSCISASKPRRPTKLPQVRKRCCQTGVMFLSLLAFTMPYFENREDRADEEERQHSADRAGRLPTDPSAEHEADGREEEGPVEITERGRLQTRVRHRRVSLRASWTRQRTEILCNEEHARSNRHVRLASAEYSWQLLRRLGCWRYRHHESAERLSPEGPGTNVHPQSDVREQGALLIRDARSASRRRSQMQRGYDITVPRTALSV